MIIGLTGRIASGKGEVGNYFQKKSFDYFTISKIVREEAERINLPITRESLQDVGNLIRKHEGNGGWIKRLISRMNLSQNNIIDGIRNPGEIEELRKMKNFYLISVDANQKIRYERVLKRSKPSDPKDWEGFLKMDERDFGENDDSGQQVGKCMTLADYHLTNDGAIEDFTKKIEDLYSQIIFR